ncbi:MAG: hypothetical protein HZA92_13705 [Verrucomicrobia bacterium]|nr:hypothetical protein [Verrucomicrobiota bacterium]
MSLPALTELDLAALCGTVARLSRTRVTALEPLAGGRNSRVFRARLDDGRDVAVKVSFRHRSDPRDRIGVEFAALRLMWRHGFRDVPEPLAANRSAGVALYEFIPGAAPTQIRAADIDALVSFLARLRGLAKEPESQKLGPASEACFSVAEMVDVLHARRARLAAAEGRAKQLVALHKFLHDEFDPALDRIVRWSRAKLPSGAFTRELPQADRTLSPSDFGFHNAVRQREGGIVWLDFEYFGWDDPAKMIVDFLLHPAKPATAALKRRFASGVLARFADQPGLRRRAEAVFPLFGLKWCLILLNEFLPADLQRRQFARAANDRDLAQRRQLAKSRAMLRRIHQQYDCNPFRA